MFQTGTTAATAFVLPLVRRGPTQLLSFHTWSRPRSRAPSGFFGFSGLCKRRLSSKTSRKIITMEMKTDTSSSVMTKNKMLHVVYRVGDLQKTKEFLSTLGMRVLRERDIPEEKYSNVFMGYGSERRGEYFSIELTYNYGVDSYDVGDFGSVGIAVGDVRKMVAKLSEKGYNIKTEAREENETVTATVEDPTGYSFELTQRSRRDPLCNVTVPVGNLDQALRFYSAIGMREVQPQAGGKTVLGYGGSQDSTFLVLKHVPGSSQKVGTGYGQIAISTPDVYKAAEAVRNNGFPVAREPGPVPGIGTKITAFRDPDGWKVVLVDENDFEKEFEN